MMNSFSEEKLVRKPSLRLYLAVISAQMGGISLGCTLGWSGPALADMARNDSSPQLTDNDHDNNMKSWIGSSMTLGALLGGILCGFCIELLGRKKTQILLGIPYTVGWVLLGFGNKIWILILGRIVTGFCSGIIVGVLPTYVTEVSTPNIRGLLGMAFNLSGVIGILYIDIMCLWLPWNHASLAPILPSILLSGSMFFMPESPNWLMSKYGRSLRVVEALHQLRQPDSDIDNELDELEDRVVINKNTENKFNAKILLRQDVYKPLLIGMVLLFFQQFSGMNALQFYMTDIFKASGSSLKPQYAVIVVNTGMLLATVIGSLAIDRLGRKILLMISGVGHSISVAVLGYYYYKHRNNETYVSTTTAFPITSMANNTSITSSIYFTAAEQYSEKSSLPVICLVVFVSAFSIGYGPVIWIVITEITHSSVAGIITSTSSFFCWIFTFAVTKGFEDIIKLMGKYGTYWMFCGISALSVLFALFLPETKGKSMEEIQRLYYPDIYKSKPTVPLQNQCQKSEVSVL